MSMKVKTKSKSNSFYKEWFAKLDDLIFPSKEDRVRSLYRIISFDSLLQMLTEKKNVLVKTSLWEDSYENFLLKENFLFHGKPESLASYQERIFGQCWTTKQSSDALWRIYSPDKKGVRIKTTIGILWDSAVKEAGEGKYTMGQVQYFPQSKIQEDLLKASPLKETDLANLVISSFFVKRNSFSHESEYRLVYMCNEDSKLKEQNTTDFTINPLDFILNVYFDPRADTAYVERCKKILVEAFKFPVKRIHKSSLYEFKPINISII